MDDDRLTDQEKALRERLSGEDWMIVKAGFRRSFDLGRASVASDGGTVPCGQCEDGCVHGTTTPCPHCRGHLVVPEAGILAEVERRFQQLERTGFTREVAIAVLHLVREEGYR